MVEINTTNATEVAKKVKAGEIPGPAKNLAEAVCRVMEQVGYIQKDKQMTGGGSYKYVSVEAVIDALRPEMIKQQLVLLPVGVETMHQGDHGRQVHLRVKYTFEMIHGPSGETKPVVVVGEGMDVGDKSSNKAMTAARKYALIMAFNIETGIDPDDTPSASQERKAAAAEPPAPKPDNLQLRARHAQAYAQAKDHTGYQVARGAAVADIEAGKLSRADISALKEIDTQTLARCPAGKQSAKA